MIPDRKGKPGISSASFPKDLKKAVSDLVAPRVTMSLAISALTRVLCSFGSLSSAARIRHSHSARQRFGAIARVFRYPFNLRPWIAKDPRGLKLVGANTSSDTTTGCMGLALRAHELLPSRARPCFNHENIFYRVRIEQLVRPRKLLKSSMFEGGLAGCFN